MINKKKNAGLVDLMNRQGLVDNDIYKLFVSIIISGIACFERYRQKIIRSIAESNKPKQKKSLRIIDEVIEKHRKF